MLHRSHMHAAHKLCRCKRWRRVQWVLACKHLVHFCTRFFCNTQQSRMQKPVVEQTCMVVRECCGYVQGLYAKVTAVVMQYTKVSAVVLQYTKLLLHMSTAPVPCKPSAIPSSSLTRPTTSCSGRTGSTWQAYTRHCKAQHLLGDSAAVCAYLDRPCDPTR